MNHLLTLCFTQGWSQLTKGMTLREIQQQGAEPKKTPWLLDFKKRLATQGLSEATIRGYSYDLQVFCEWSKAFRDTAELKGLTETDLNAYRRFLLKEKNLKANTVNRRLLSLKKAITWGTKKGQVTEGMAGSVRLVPKGEKRLPKALNLKEVHALLRASGLSPHGQAKRNYAVVQVLLQTGLRVSEIVALKASDVTLLERSGDVSVRLGKGEKDRTVPLNASVRRALKDYLATRDGVVKGSPLFESERAEPLSVRSIQYMISELSRRANITRIPVSPHTLRHTFAVNYLQDNQGKVVELATLLGHESLDTTAIYCRPDDEKLADDLEKSQLNAYD